LDEQFDVVSFITNYCIIQYNQGEDDYLREAFDMYKYGLEQSVWIEDGIIDYNLFDNIVGVACNLKQYQWAESFIHQYTECLKAEVRADTKMMALCRLEFNKGNFEKTLELLRDMDFVDVKRSLSAKTFQLRCYYELDGYEEVFYDAINAFVAYCRRNKIVGKQGKERYLYFVKFLKKLHEAKYHNKENQATLLEKLKKQPIILKVWLEQKIYEDIKKTNA